jgi:hypothetical protein
MTDDWGTKHNGCRVGLRFTDSFEYSADGSEARIHDFDCMFSSDNPMYDTSNSLVISGNAITDGTYSNEVNKSSSWSGTMTMRTQSGQWNTLNYGSTQNHDAKLVMHDISYAGSDLTTTHTFTYPRREYDIPYQGVVSVGAVTPTSAVIDWSFPSATASTDYGPVTVSTLYVSINGGGWVALSTVSHSGAAWPSASFNHTGLSPANSYVYMCQGANLDYTSLPSANQYLWFAPTGPTVGTVVRNSDASHSVYWTNNHSGRSSASDNYVYMRMDGGGWQLLAIVGATTTGYTYTGGTANHYYEFTVNSHNSAGWGYGALSNMIYNSVSAPISAAFGTTSVTTNHASGIVDGISQKSQGTISWSHAAPTYVQAYEVWIDGVKYGADTAATSMLIQGLTAGQTYTAVVKAKHTTGTAFTSGNSNSAYVTGNTLLSGPATVTLGALSASGGKSSGTLSWTAVSGAISYYVTAISSSGVPNTSVVAGTSVTVSNIGPGELTQFGVRVLNAVGYSAQTASQSSVYAPNVPDAPQAVDASYAAGTLSFSWAAPAGNGGSPVSSYQYKLEYQDVANGAWLLDTDWTSVGNVIAYSIDKPTVINYRVSVRAVNGIGAGTESFAETGIIGGYVRIKNAIGGWDDVFLKINVAGVFSKSAIVRTFDGTNWVPLTYS